MVDEHGDPITDRAKVFTALMQSLGFPVIVSCALLYAAWLLGSSLVESHHQLITSLARENEKQTALLESLSDVLRTQAKDHEETMRKVVDNQGVIIDTQRMIIQMLGEHRPNKRVEENK